MKKNLLSVDVENFVTETTFDTMPELLEGTAAVLLLIAGSSEVSLQIRGAAAALLSEIRFPGLQRSDR